MILHYKKALHDALSPPNLFGGRDDCALRTTRNVNGPSPHQIDFSDRHDCAPATRDFYSRQLSFAGNSLAKPCSLEKHQRIQKLLAEGKRPLTSDEVRLLRAVKVMVLADTKAARKLLRRWADGAPGYLLTEQAKRALQRR